jgi:hypothetical protein
MADRRVLLTLGAAGILALGAAAAGLFVGQGAVRFRGADRAVTVHGLSERVVKADIAVLPLRFTGAGDQLADVQAKVDRDLATVRKFLAEQGFKPDEVDLGRMEVTDHYAQEYQSSRTPTRYHVAQTVIVRSANVDLVQGTTRHLDVLVRAGVALNNGTGPTYLFTRLNDVRPPMIAEATASARSGAQQFAHDSGSALGPIRRASQGSFEILGRDEIGYDSNSQVFKKVRVVTTVSYQLR